jgi:hypothetical protein
MHPKYRSEALRLRRLDRPMRFGDLVAVREHTLERIPPSGVRRGPRSSTAPCRGRRRPLNFGWWHHVYLSLSIPAPCATSGWELH